MVVTPSSTAIWRTSSFRPLYAKEDVLAVTWMCRAVAHQVRASDSGIMGVMLESNLRPGRQSWVPGGTLRRGVSITDACIGWNETVDLLHELAEAVKLSS